MSKLSLGLWVVLLSLVAGCGGPAPADDAAVPTDTNPPVDAFHPECVTDMDCADGLFCNGNERCTAGRCVAGTVACDDGVACTQDTCSETLRNCAHAAPDVDMDGYGDAACVDGAGVPIGNDCNDHDANTFPGNHEVCDAMGHDEDCDPMTQGGTDADSDGYESHTCCNPNPTSGAMPICGNDCDDARASVSPVGTEVCNGIDDDCDGMIDEGTLLDGFIDADFDGYGGSIAAMRCPGTSGFSTVGGDCDDMNPYANPGLPELCDVGAPVDNNCDGSTTDTPGTTNWYGDADGDGFGSSTTSVTESCTPVPNTSLRNTDCDDSHADINPSQAERCDGLDDDCNGRADYQIAPGNFEDDDGDHFIDIACAPVGNDCDDNNAAVGPGEAEQCDGQDNDCDGHVDEDAMTLVYYRDIDMDGYGSDSSGTIVACMSRMGYVARAGDCNDMDPTRYPMAAEHCDGADNDCDAAVDEDPAATNCASIPHATAACTSGHCVIGTCTTGYSDCNHDMSDGCEATGVGPGQPDNCDGIDNDCDGRIDEDAPTQVYYRDFDGDGYGSSASGSVVACRAPSGYVSMAGDCNDADVTRHPGGIEICDGGDNDCDAAIDEAPASASCSGLAHAVGACVTGGTCGIVSCNGGYADCDHTASDGCEIAVSPTDGCDGVDNDCDGRIDEDATTRVYYRDNDGDGFGSSVSGTTIDCQTPTGFSPTAGDCADMDPTRFPGAAEHCNGNDDDCDAAVDEAPAPSFCSVANAVPSCTLGVCGIMSCTGGYADCNHDASDGCEAYGAGPGHPDLCDGVDNDCDGRFDEDVSTSVFYRDLDHDGYGATSSGTVIACAAPAGYVASAGDCNDMNEGRFPGASETCNGADDDCDSAVDEAPATASCGSVSHGTAGCLSGGHCGIASCSAGFADCNVDSTDGCESALATDVNHCGNCSTDCNAAPRVTAATCTASHCQVTGCSFGYADCDAFAANGCEIATQSDPLNCGSCGHTCGVSEVCSAGTCALGCAPGLIVCDGRCVNPMTDVSYCGANGACSTTAERGSVCRPGEACASGACFASFISPGIDAVSITAPRDLTFTLDAPGAATIFYTLDGTVPGVSGSTVTVAAPVTLAPLPGPSPVRIRWVAQFAGGSTETIVHQVDVGVSTGYASSLGQLTELLNMNGEGPVAVVSPGATVTGSAQLETWRSDSSGYCPGCVLVPDLGCDGVGQIMCYGPYGGSTYPGTTGTYGFTFTAPSTPGRYYIRSGIGLVFDCPSAGGGGGPVGVLYVR